MTRSVDKLALQYQERASEYNLIKKEGRLFWLGLTDEIRECVEELNRHMGGIVLNIDAKDGIISVRRKFDNQTMRCRFDEAENIAYFDSEKPEFHFVMPLEARGGALTFSAPSNDGSRYPRQSEDIAFEVISSFLSK